MTRKYTVSDKVLKQRRDAARAMAEVPADKKALYLKTYPEHLTMKRTCEVLGIPKQTVCQWLVSDLEFAQSYRNLQLIHLEEINEVFYEAGKGKRKMSMPQVVAGSIMQKALAPQIYNEKFAAEKTQNPVQVIMIEVNRPSGKFPPQLSAPTIDGNTGEIIDSNKIKEAEYADKE